MEEKELEQQTTVTETTKKGKGGKKKADSTKVTETQTPETPITDSPETEAPVETLEEQKEVIVETPKDEHPIDNAPNAENATVVEDNVSKSVPTIAELRKQRRFNESIFTFADGFACVATSQRVADMKHSAWLQA